MSLTNRSYSCLAMLMAFTAPSRLSAQTSAELNRLSWLAGCWELSTPSRVTQEQWMAPQGGLMLGMSRTVARDTAREYEFLRIEVRNGVPTYVAQPSGQAMAAFAATSVSDTAVIFANPAHDFPQRISYRKRGADSLIARIEGERSGQVRGIDFPMGRVRCGEKKQ